MQYLWSHATLMATVQAASVTYPAVRGRSDRGDSGASWVAKPPLAVCCSTSMTSVSRALWEMNWTWLNSASSSWSSRVCVHHGKFTTQRRRMSLGMDEGHQLSVRLIGVSTLWHRLSGGMHRCNVNCQCVPRSLPCRFHAAGGRPTSVGAVSDSTASHTPESPELGVHRPPSAPSPRWRKRDDSSPVPSHTGRCPVDGHGRA